MTSDRTRMRARLASALDEAADIETRSIDEVRAALAEQGIDPTASIKLAQKFSRGRGVGDPSARLLQHIERSEALDAEIAALEEADIDDIRAALPGQRNGHRSEAEVTPIKPQRRRLSMLGWGGSLVGIAASVLLFIAVRPDRLDQVQAPLPAIEAEVSVAADRESADTVSEDVLQRSDQRAQTLSPEISQLRGKTSGDSDQFAARQADLSDAARKALVEEAEAQPRPRQLEKTARPLAQSRERAPVKSAEADLSAETRVPNVRPLPSPPRPDFAEGESGGATALAPATSPAPAIATAEPPRNPPRPAPRPDVGENAAAGMAVLRSGTPSAEREEAPIFPERGSENDVLSAIGSDFRAILLVDEASAPEALRALSKRLPQGQLAAKVGEAELRASSGKVVALVAFNRDGELVEAALVETRITPPPDLLVGTFDGATAFVDVYEPASAVSEASFELIELSAGD